jgi:ABC-type lipoprotein release transport system permease subunit
MCLRSEVRRGLGGFALGILIATIAGGAALTAAAGARRSDSAYPRLLRWSHHADFGTGGAPNDRILASDLAAIENAPFVAEAAHIPVVGAHVRLPSGKEVQPFQVTVVDDADSVLARGTLDREKVLRGRRSDPASPDDATVSFTTAERLGVDVGDSITLVPDEGGPTVTVKVVGVVVRTSEFPTLSGATRSSVAVTSAFGRAHPSLITPGNDGVLARVKPGTSRAEVERWLRSHVRGTDIEDASVAFASIAHTIRLETVALWAVAIVLAVVFSVLVAQFLLRQALAAADDMTRLTTLGFTHAQVARLGAARGAVLGLLGAAGAVIAAIVASPLTPVGLGRLAEPKPGVRIDAGVLALGFAVFATMATAFGAVAAQRASLPNAYGRRRRRRAALPNLPPALRAGWQTLARPTTRRDAGATRAVLASLCVVIAAASAVLIMLASLSHVRHTPALVGATWDGAFVVDNPPTERHLDAALARAAAIPGVAAVAASGWTTVTAGDREIPVQVFDDGSTIGPAIAAGRAPARAGEIALGADEMHRLHAGIGDRMKIAARAGARPVDALVVGRSVLVAPVFRTTGPGDGAALAASTMSMLGVERRDAAALVIARFAPGVDQELAVDRVRRALNATFAFSSQDRTIVGGVERVQTVPFALIVVLAVLGAGAFVHFQLVSTRRRRLDIAVLQTMGFTRRQVISMVEAQAVGVALLAAAIGVPLGVLAGRVGWERFADYIRAVPETTTTPAVIAGVALVLAVIALGAGLAAGVRAALLRPARVLRTETG